jgi:L-lactate dehydrogenase
MRINRSKVAIVGCGLVGASTGFSLLTQGVCDEIRMIDINKEKALGEVLDMRDDVEYLNRNTKVMTGTYEDCKDADIVVITAGAPPKKGQSRLDTLDVSAKIAKSIVEPIMAAGFDGTFIIISNPVDIIAHYIQRISGLPKNQVIGTGTALDSARLKNIIAEIVHVDQRSVYAYSLGEHGDSQMVPWSLVTVGGKKFQDIIVDNPELMKGIELDDIVAKTIRAGWEIFDRKGTTSFGIATAAVGIIKAILHDENKIIPVSTLLEGEYEQKNVYCGVPVILNRKGASDILELHMSDNERERFHKSAEVIRNYTQGYFKEAGLL